MSDTEMTYDEALETVEGMVGERVHVYIAGEKGAFIGGVVGLLREVDELFFAQNLPAYVARGGDDEARMFYVDGGQDEGVRPFLMICRALFNSAEPVEEDELAGFSRGLTLVVGRVMLSIAVEEVG